MTREEIVKNLLTELIDMIDNGSQRDLDRADEISKTIIEALLQEQTSGTWDRSCTCSVCGQWRILESEKNGGKYKYCPNCGSAMKGE